MVHRNFLYKCLSLSFDLLADNLSSYVYNIYKYIKLHKKKRQTIYDSLYEFKK